MILWTRNQPDPFQPTIGSFDGHEMSLKHEISEATKEQKYDEESSLIA
jgi:hypothetical protein